MSGQQWRRVFADVHKFQDDVWGQIDFNYLERDVIDTPEFQRLFRTSQLGFVDLVYQTANHSRGAHSIGACHVANQLMDWLAKNSIHSEPSDGRYAAIEISTAERVLIRLGALVHDITHVAFSHDVERKTHRVVFGSEPTDFIKVQSHYGHYEKHDDYEANPLLYQLLFDTKISVLARVLAAYSTPFYTMLLEAKGKAPHSHVQHFLSLLEKARDEHNWEPAVKLLPALLFHLLIYETMPEADHPVRPIAIGYKNGNREVREWGLGPSALHAELHRAWYQPFRHDIIGNTLSADLIDYLKRDMRRLAMDRKCDLHLLNYYVLVGLESVNSRSDKRGGTENVEQGNGGGQHLFRCAIEIQDHKRGTSRVGLINDIFRLLDLRHDIHEKAVMHRVTQSANAMMSRALLLMDESKPKHYELLTLGTEAHALQGEDLFLDLLLRRKCTSTDATARRSFDDAHRIIHKLIDRRVYRPLVIIPGDRAAKHFACAGYKGSAVGQTEYLLRSLGAIVDSKYYSNFLLFVSACIEELLIGRFDSVDGLTHHVKRTLEDCRAVPSVMGLRPSRVIMWSTPYKQLYKDPAVVVALKTRIARIDELGSDRSGEDSSEASVIDRVRVSIQDADSKYAALWKLYVFVSDGLYYTGILNKLQMAVSGDASDGHLKHVTRLRNSEALVLAALEAIVETWSNYCEREASRVERRNRLIGEMPQDQFVSVGHLWLSKFGANENRDVNSTRGLSEVDIEHYVHEWDGSRCPVESKCRDVRYKYPVSAEWVWSEAKRMPADTDSRQLVDFLERCGVEDFSILSDAEFQQLLSQLTGETRERCAALARGAGTHKLPASTLKILWPSALGAETAPATASPPTSPVRTDVPQSRKQAKEWLRSEARALSPHVRGRFTRDLEPLLDLLFNDINDDGIREAAMIDLQHRIVNEGTKIFNNFKTAQVVRSLRRRWLDQLAEGRMEMESR